MDKTTAAIINITNADIDKMRKEVLQQTLKQAIPLIKQADAATVTQPTDGGNIETLLKELQRQNKDNFLQLNNRLDSIAESVKDDLRKEFQPQLDKMGSQISETKVALNNENKEMMKTLPIHQQFLESLDHENRSKAVIITGVPEEDDLTIDEGTAESDKEKCTLIFDKLDQVATIRKVQRLGKVEAERNRPIKVELQDREERDAIIASAKNLKDTSNKENVTNKIYIKKDQHPLVRKEWQRLYEVQNNERDRPENAGRTIVVDRKTRTVKVDGNVIDKFQGF